MLPYTPLHHLLFEDGLEILVATSANISDDPLIIDNDEAVVKLKGIADYFLMHNRQIYNRCDDSVATVLDGEAPMIRRARGYVPLPVDLPVTEVEARGQRSERMETRPDSGVTSAPGNLLQRVGHSGRGR